MTQLSVPASANSATLTQVCREHRQEPAEIITSEMNQNSEQNDGFSTGLLWKVETQERQFSYLFGTIHSQDQLVTKFPPKVRLALAQSESFVIESVLTEESNKVFFDSAFSSNNEKLSDLIVNPIYQYLQKVLPDYGVSVEEILYLKPWAAFTLIGKPKPVNAATLDMVLIDTARSLNKDIIGLETMEELIEPMNNLSTGDQVIILNDTVCNHKQVIRDSWELVQLYLAGNLSGMMEFNNQPHYDEDVFDRYIQGILYDRNERMLERIIPYLNKGSAFIAVGALHLAGEKGLLKSLKDKNHTITRIY